MGGFAGTIRGSGSLLKTGAGSYELIGSNEFTGRVTVEGGSLRMSNGAASSYRVGAGATLGLDFASLSAPLQVDAGGVLSLSNATLSGAALVNQGRVDGALTLRAGASATGNGRFGALTVGDGGRFSPGQSPGLAHTGDAVWGGGGAYVIDLAVAPSGARNSGSAGIHECPRALDPRAPRCQGRSCGRRRGHRRTQPARPPARGARVAR